MSDFIADPAVFAATAYLSIAATWTYLFSATVTPRSWGEWVGLFLCVVFWPAWLAWAIFTHRSRL